jgi:Cytochrome C oxidase subunit II, transmembrane domain/GIY-YIG catalytic domain
MFNTLPIFNTIYNDVPQPWQIGFQDSAAPGFTGIIELHNTIFFYLIVICVGVFWVLGSSIYYFNIKNSPIIHKYLNHGRYVPIQKYFKLDNKIKQFISIRTYSKLSDNQWKYEKVYENIFNMKKDILNENKGKSGIYMLTNKLTNDLYIGQSINISNRFKNYFNLSYLKSKNSLIISRALIKYEYSNFSLTILEYCDKSDLLVREQYYFDKLNPQYNLLKVAGSSLNSKHTKETKVNISGNLVNIYEKFTSSEFKLIGSFVSARRVGKFLGVSGSTVIKYMNSGEIYKDRYKFSSK